MACPSPITGPEISLLPFTHLTNIHPSIPPSIHPSLHPSFHLHTRTQHQSFYPGSIHLCTYFIHPISIDPFIHLSIHPSSIWSERQRSAPSRRAPELIRSGPQRALGAASNHGQWHILIFSKAEMGWEGDLGIRTKKGTQGLRSSRPELNQITVLLLYLVT